MWACMRVGGVRGWGAIMSVSLQVPALFKILSSLIVEIDQCKMGDLGTIYFLRGLNNYAMVI